MLTRDPANASYRPVTKGAFSAVTLGLAKAAGIIVVTKELITLTAHGAEAVLRDEMVRGISQFVDEQFVDPAVGATTANPASITNGVTPIAASGTTAAALVTDVKALIAAFVAANPSVAFLVVLMTPAIAAALAIATNASTLTLADGSIFGVPVVTSPSVGARIVALDAQSILLADDGGIEIDVSQQAAVQMDSQPDLENAVHRIDAVLVPMGLDELIRRAHPPGTQPRGHWSRPPPSADASSVHKILGTPPVAHGHRLSSSSWIKHSYNLVMI